MAFLLIACIQLLNAQGVQQIKGKVTSEEDGSALPGASVIVKGTSVATVTDAEGNYTLNLPNGATSIIVSFVGMSTQEVQIAGQTKIDVVLKSEVKGLDEVVVTAIGIKRSEKSLGYSATQVSSDEISESKEHSVLNSLEGKVAGVNITSASGAPGASTKIILRGYSTLRENNQPLFIVDGVSINNDQVGTSSVSSTDNNVDFGNRANDINPDDIESVTILKGAAASALYGSRAANGVIEITTKSGKASDKVLVDFSSSLTLSSPLRLPQWQDVFGQGWAGWHDLTQNGSWGAKFDGKMRVWGNVVDNSQMLKPYVALPSTYADFWDIGKTYNNSISIRGGNEKSNYYASYSNDNEDGIVPGPVDSYNRNTISLKGSTSGKHLKLTGSMNYINKQQRFVPTGNGGSTGATLYGDIIQTPNDISIVDMKDYNNKFFNLDNFFTPYAGNPYRSLNENGAKYNEDRIFGSIFLEYQITNWLKANYRAGTDVSNGQRQDWDAIAIPDLNGYNASYQPVPGNDRERYIHSQELNSNFFLTSENKLSDNLKLNILAGYEALQQFHQYLYSEVLSLNIPGFYNLSNSSATANTYTYDPINDNGTYKKRLYGIYGQAEFAYKELWFTTITGRNDISSTLPTNHNSYFYPSISTSFLLTDAFEGLKSFMSFGKIRASWGMTGNDADPYKLQTSFQPQNIQEAYGYLKFPIANVNAYTISNILGNPNLKPELSSEWEVGTDLRFLNSRIGIDFSYYDKTTKDLILNVPLAPTSGYTSQVQNVGEIENKGIELQLSLTPIKTDDFTWDMKFNYTRNRGECVSLNNQVSKVLLTNAYSVDFVVKPGAPIGVFEGPTALTDGNGHVVVGTNGYPLAAPDKVDYGNAQANYTLGIVNQFTYKGISLSCLFDIRQGGIMYSETADLTYFVGNATQSLFNDRQPFVVPNSVVQTGTDNSGKPIYSENSKAIDYAAMDGYYYPSTNPVSSRDRMIDRSYVKLREASIFYTFPKSLFTNLFIQGLSLGVVGRNLLLWTPKSNNFIDPESTTFGNDLRGDFGEFQGGPTVRSVNFSLKAAF